MATTTQMLELLIRGAASGNFVLLALGVISGGRAPARMTGGLFCLAAASHVLTQFPIAFDALGVGSLPVWVMSVTGAGLFWAFAAELFGDNARLAAWRFLPAIALLVIGGLATTTTPEAARALWLLHNLVGAVLMLHVLLVVWTGWRGDLVEARRRLRGPLLGVAALYALVVVSVQAGELFTQPADQLSLLAAVSLLAMSLASAAVFLRADSQLFGPRIGSTRAAAPDSLLLGRLQEALKTQDLWRQEGLTIGKLAETLHAPEHHLRKLINEGLGYRNFAAFINERRIAAAMLELGDPAKRRVTVATIAYDAGFSSLGPFNRAFRDSTGGTPTAWRRAALEDRLNSDPSLISRESD